METEIIKIDKDNIDIEKINRAASFIKDGELVAMPTETVYGLGADGLNEEAVKKIFIAKNRPGDNPLILHISSIDEVDRLVKNVKEKDKKVMESLWPGPVTLIYEKKDIVPKEVTAGGNTVGLRMPSNKIAREFIKASKTPIAAPSANLSGRPSPTNCEDVFMDMNGRIRCIIDGGDRDIGIESTVIDMTEDEPIILRPGFYTLEYLKEIIPGIKMDTRLNTAIPRSPGQKYKHYAPKAEFIVFIGKQEDVRKEILAEIDKAKKKKQKIGVMSFIEDASYDVDLELNIGSFKDITEMGHLLFKNLREFDRNNVDIIFGVGVIEEGYGTSIMNRLKKACGGNVRYL